MKIELLWFDGCPNHEHARALLEDVLRELGVRQSIETIRVDDAASAEAAHFPGSPTIRVDGVDIEPGFEDPGEYALECRLYHTRAGFRGVAERAWIEAAVASKPR